MNKKNAVKIIGITCFVCLSLSACGKNQEKPVSPVLIEGMQSESTQTNSSEENNPADSQTQSEHPLNRQDEEPVSQSLIDEIQSESTNKNTSSQNNPDKSQAQTEQSVNQQEVLDGIVEELSAGSFMINKIFSEKMENGLISYSSNDDKTLITVKYTESTVFILRTVLNSGIDPSDVTDHNSSIKALKANNSVTMKGHYLEDNVFEAAEIVIYDFK